VGERDGRRGDGYSQEQRVRLLEQDADKAEVERGHLESELARIKGLALSLLLTVVVALVVAFLTTGGPS